MNIQLTEQNATEVSPHRFCAELSELGHVVGQPLPKEIETNLGNKRPLVLKHEINGEYEDCKSWLYVQDLGLLELEIFND